MKLDHFFNVVYYKAISELRAEATRTYAGYIWWVLQPLLSLAVYYIAFNWIVVRRMENYAVFLFSGIIYWQWFQMSVLRASGALIESRGLMQQVNLHKAVFPLAIVLVNSVKFTITFALLIVVLLITGYHPSWAWLSIPPLLLVELFLIAGLCCAVASISPFLPDFQLILGTVLQLLFFLSGIFYDLSRLPDNLHTVLKFNPMAVLIVQYRHVLLDQQWPEWHALLIPIGEAAVILVVALALLQRFNKVYPKLS